MNDAFGGEGADKLMVRLTRIMALVFMALAIFIGQYINLDSKGLLDSTDPETEQTGGTEGG